jgi:hypothetical protein
MTKQREKVVETLLHANLYLMNYGHRDAAINVARELVADAERRVRCGFGPVPSQDCENLLAIENRYLEKYCTRCGRPTSEPHCGYGTNWQ